LRYPIPAPQRQTSPLFLPDITRKHEAWLACPMPSLKPGLSFLELIGKPHKKSFNTTNKINCPGRKPPGQSL